MSIQELIQKLANKGISNLSICKVTEVDEQANTCTCEPVDGSATIYEVRLQASINSDTGVFTIPSVNSLVIVGFVNNAVAVIIAATEITKFAVFIDDKSLEITKDGVVFNGGGLGGLIDIFKLKTEIAKNSAAITAIKTAVETSPITPQDGGAAFKAGLIAQLQTIQTADLSNIENPNVKHG